MCLVKEQEVCPSLAVSRGGSSHHFWRRTDVENSRRLVDLWASCKRARLAGCAGCPTVDAVFERPVPTEAPWRDPRTGLWVTDEEFFIPTVTLRALPESRLAELEVDQSLKEMGNPRLAISLLFYLYPRSGPYQQEGEISEFRPKALFGKLQGRYLDRARLSLANQLHREAIAKIAQRDRALGAMQPQQVETEKCDKEVA